MKTPIIRNQLKTEELKRLVSKRSVDFCKFLARNKITIPGDSEPWLDDFDFSAVPYTSKDGTKFDFDFVADLYAACVDVAKSSTGKDFLYIDC